MKRTGRYYLVRDEEEPYRTCRNKNFMGKVMLLCALTRPRIDNEGKCYFDGKIGCFPLVTYEPARRTSKNRVAGTLEMKPITSITKEVMRAFIIEKVIPAIWEKWPSEDAGKPIFIQQDNARPHIDPSDPLFCEAAQQDGFNIQLICQPPNSPDLNILDLGFFASIQSIQFKNSNRTVLDIVDVVQREFEKYSPSLSNKIFLTLQAVMIEVIKARGGNNYKTPHINKALLEREGKLPWQLKCDLHLVQDVRMQVEE
uniref:Tc1-like transposase DDE domain-containing protein n=1 Tax=Arundo donax TaxID=35708 RepID=A0A0A9EXU2_ARUDO